MSKHVLVLGATGPSGLSFCDQALEAGHSLTLYVRNPSKLPSRISEKQNVTIIQGEFNDRKGLNQAAACGATAFASFAGPLLSNKGTPISDAYAILFPLLISNDYSRALVLCTPTYKVPEDIDTLKWRAVIAFIWVAGGSAYKEVTSIGKLTTEQPVERLKWTLFRVPFLRSGQAKPVVTAYAGSGEDGMFLNRASMAAWVLQELKDDSEWVGKAPMISD